VHRQILVVPQLLRDGFLASKMASTDSPPSSPVLSMTDPRLSDVAALGDDAAALVSLLLREDQGHVLAAWRAGAAEQEAGKRALLEQLRGLERGYPGGLAAYLRNARALLAQSAAGDNPFEGMRPEVRACALARAAQPPRTRRRPTSTLARPRARRCRRASRSRTAPMTLSRTKTRASAPFATARLCSSRVAWESAWVIRCAETRARAAPHRAPLAPAPANGQPTLRFPPWQGIKLSLPVESVTGRCYLQLYIEQILAMTVRAREERGEEWEDAQRISPVLAAAASVARARSAAGPLCIPAAPAGAVEQAGGRVVAAARSAAGDHDVGRHARAHGGAAGGARQLWHGGGAGDAAEAGKGGGAGGQ
jgi:hypothetical protein